MAISFSKYQGTGNDFIIIDNRRNVFAKNDTKLIKTLCDRKFGIGADGLMLLEDHLSLDFTMVYYNADGTSSMCGNGGRCITAFAKRLGIIEDTAIFEAIDGIHRAHFVGDIVSLSMQDVNLVEDGDGFVFLNTGSPHHVQFANDLEVMDVRTIGRRIRNSVMYGTEGSNINFVKQDRNIFKVRTYERGVEDETLSCGTGVTAVALAMHHLKKTSRDRVDIDTMGGKLQVAFKKIENGYGDINLIGPANLVFNGVWPE